jgi:hypothetical protein
MRAALLLLLGAVAKASLVDRTTLRTVSVTGGGAANPSLFHMVRPDTPGLSSWPSPPSPR